MADALQPKTPRGEFDPASDTIHHIEGAFALLAEMTQCFAGSLDIESTLEQALASIAEHLQAEAGSLWLLDPDRGELHCRASVGWSFSGKTRLTAGH